MAPDVASLNESKQGLTVSRDRSSSLLVPYQPETEELYGRSFAPARFGEEYRYYLPVDRSQLIREELCHALWTMAGSLAVLVNFEDIPPAIVFDLGAGWGKWVEDASIRWPQHKIVGLDLHFESAQISMFDNCHFEVDNYEAPFFPQERQVALIHLRDSYFSLRNPRELAGHIVEALCNGGWFQNEEMRLENWTSNKPKFNDWCRRTMEAARSLGIPLHSAQDIETSLREAGLGIDLVQKIQWEASEGTNTGKKLLEVVRLTVVASIRILVEGGSCANDDVDDFVKEVVRELGEEDCMVIIGVEVVLARKWIVQDGVQEEI